MKLSWKFVVSHSCPGGEDFAVSGHNLMLANKAGAGFKLCWPPSNRIIFLPKWLQYLERVTFPRILIRPRSVAVVPFCYCFPAKRANCCDFAYFERTKHRKSALAALKWRFCYSSKQQNSFILFFLAVYSEVVLCAFFRDNFSIHYGLWERAGVRI